MVPAISVRHVGRPSPRVRYGPQTFQYWLTGDPDERKVEKIHAICEVYQEAPARTEQGELSMSVDEKSGCKPLNEMPPPNP